MTKAEVRRPTAKSRQRRKTYNRLNNQGVTSPVQRAGVVKVIECSTDLAGSGGCAARTLSKLGLVGQGVEEVTKNLNASIDAVLDIFNRNRPLRDHDRRRVGVEGVEWCYDVIRHALKKTSSPYYLKKQVIHNGDCAVLLGDGDFFVDGHLDRSYVQYMPGGVGGDRMYQSGHDDPLYAPDGTWRHSVAVKDGRVYCDGLADCGVPVGTLWLDEHGRPNPTRGYMKRILKVYKVERS